MRVAAIDCGTNSVRLLVADVEDGRIVDVDRRMRIVRLGEGVDRTGEFSPAALDRLFAACDEYARVIEDLGAERIRFIATSASRDVRNRDAFAAGVRERLGVDPEVITGDEEAELSFLGAVGGLPDARLAMPVLVVDIGGGSTEFVLGAAEPEASVSVDIGCVRLTERHLHDDPPTTAQVERTVADIEAALDRAAARVPLRTAGSLVGLAGTVTTMCALAHGHDEYDPALLHGARMSADDVRRVCASLLPATRAERASSPVMHPGRVDVIAGGALILRAIVDRVGIDEVVVSECDILDGIAAALGGLP